MKYFKSLSAELNAAIYICPQGKIYANTGNGMKRIGSINDCIHALKDNI